MKHRTLPEHICPTCHKRYRPRSNHQIYCSIACRHGIAPSLIGNDRWAEPINLRDEVALAKAESETAPLYRYWHRHL